MNGQPQHSSTIAIALGDAGGIGPEVALKAVAADLSVDDSRYLLIGDESLVHSLNEQLGLRLDIRPAAEAKPTDRVTIVNPLPATLPHSALRNPHSPEAARAAIGLEASERIAGFIHIGQASETPADRPRPDLDQIASHWQA